MKQKVLNFYGQPSAGKSTIAALVFAYLKLSGVNAELVTEYAKDKVWEKNGKVFENPFYIGGKQSFRISKLKGEVDIIITDSPIMLAGFYSNYSQAYVDLLKEVVDEYNNINVLLKPKTNKVYNPKGRFQTEEEAIIIGYKLVKYLEDNSIPYISRIGNTDTAVELTTRVLEIL